MVKSSMQSNLFTPIKTYFTRFLSLLHCPYGVSETSDNKKNCCDLEVFSSPESKAPGGGAYSIGRLRRPSYVVHHTSFVRSCVHNFKRLLL